MPYLPILFLAVTQCGITESRLDMKIGYKFLKSAGSIIEIKEDALRTHICLLSPPAMTIEQKVLVAPDKENLRHYLAGHSPVKNLPRCQIELLEFYAPRDYVLFGVSIPAYHHFSHICRNLLLIAYVQSAANHLSCHPGPAVQPKCIKKAETHSTKLSGRYCRLRLSG